MPELFRRAAGTTVRLLDLRVMASGPRNAVKMPSVALAGRRAVVLATLVSTAAALAGCHTPVDVKKFQGSPERLYDVSYRAYQRHRWDDAVAGFEKLTLELPAHDTLLARSYYYLGVAHEKKGEPLLAAQSFSRLADAFPDDSLAAPALFAAGRSYEHMWRRPDLDATYGQSALSEYQTLLALYPSSPLKDRTDRRVAHLQEWFAEKDYKNGLHYYHRKAYDSAIIYFKDVIKNYPNVPATRDAYLRLVDSYRAIRYKDDAADVCNTLRITYPQDPGVRERCGTGTANTTAEHP
jgi:outer membrane assembly lipoprotein YfiO